MLLMPEFRFQKRRVWSVRMRRPISGCRTGGTIALDLLADFTVLDERFQVSEVWVNGERRV